jgi:hypothetical protein
MVLAEREHKMIKRRDAIICLSRVPCDRILSDEAMSLLVLQNRFSRNAGRKLAN